MVPCISVLKIASQEYSTMAAISRVGRSARDSASVFCRAMLLANMDMTRKASRRSRSALVLTPKVKYGGKAKKSRQAVEISEEKTAGPNPRKRAVKRTAASRSAKRWRCRSGEKVQRLSATHTASAAPKYCAQGK